MNKAITDFANSTYVDKVTGPRGPCAWDPMCLDVGDVPPIENIRTTLIDPDTPESAKSIKSADSKEWKLVVCAFSPLWWARADVRVVFRRV